MKSYLKLILSLTLTCLFLAGCSVNSVAPVTPPSTTGTPVAAIPISATDLTLIRTGASVASGAVLNFAVTQVSTRTKDANAMYAAANAIYSLSNGTLPTPTQFSNTVLAFGGSQTDAGYAQFTTAIAGLYASYYPKLQAGNGANILAVLGALAAGIQDATASYVVVPAPTVVSTSSN